VDCLSPFSYIIKHIKTYKSIPFLFEMAEGKNRNLEFSISSTDPFFKEKVGACVKSGLRELAWATPQGLAVLGLAYAAISCYFGQALSNLTYALTIGGP
jgi:hypothetical protein